MQCEHKKSKGKVKRSMVVTGSNANYVAYEKFIFTGSFSIARNIEVVIKLIQVQFLLTPGICPGLADLNRMRVTVSRNTALHFVQVLYHIIQVAHVKEMPAFAFHIVMPFMGSYVL
jgi:hypothetical protein